MKKKNGIDVINIFKYGMVVILAAYVIWLLMLQGGTNTPIETMKKNLLAVSDTKGMKKATTQDLKKYYGLNARDYRDAVLYIPDDVMGVNELMVIRLADVGQAEEVEKAAQKRLDTQKSSFEGYGAKQTKLINQAVIESRGDYVLMIISKDADEIQKAFRKSL